MSDLGNHKTRKPYIAIAVALAGMTVALSLLARLGVDDPIESSRREI